jgi:Trypsin-like peptidase domain
VWGTGYLVAPDLVVTCAHLIRHFADEETTADFANRFRVGARVVAADETSDIAILRLSEPCTDVEPLPLSNASVKIDQKWLSYSYPEHARDWGLMLSGSVIDPDGIIDGTPAVFLRADEALSLASGHGLRGCSAGSP